MVAPGQAGELMWDAGEREWKRDCTMGPYGISHILRAEGDVFMKGSVRREGTSGVTLLQELE